MTLAVPGTVIADVAWPEHRVAGDRDVGGCMRTPNVGSDARRFVLIVAGLALVGFLLRAVYVFAVAPSNLGPDALWYFFVSATVAHGDGYVDPGSFFHHMGSSVPTATFPPGWTLVLAAARFVGINSQQGLRLIGAALGSVTVVLTGFVGRRVAGNRVGIVAAAIVAASPLLIAGDGSLMSEPLYVALVTGSVLLAYSTLAAPTWPRFVGLAVLAGAATLTRSEGILVVGAIVVVTLWRAPLDRGHVLKFCAISAATFLVVLAPWTIRNVLNFDEVVPLSTNSGSLVEGANCPSTYSGRLLGAWDYRCLTTVKQLGADPAVAATSLRRGGRYALDNVARWPLVGAARVLRTWGAWDPVAQADLEAVETRNSHWQLAGWFYGVVSIAAGVVGLVVLVRRRTTVALLVTVIIAVTVSALLSWGNQRFRLAAEPAVAVLAAVAAVHASELLSAKRRTENRSSVGSAPHRERAT